MDINIFPNPNNGSFNLVLDRITDIMDYQLEIINISGQLIYQKTLNIRAEQHNENIIIPEAVVTGAYFLILKNKKGLPVAAKNIQITR